MAKNKYVVSAIVVMLLVVGGIWSWQKFKQPTSFLAENEMIAEMNSYTGQFKVEEILDVQKVDTHHYFVPFINRDGQKAMSFWKWEKAKWNLIELTTNQKLRWQLDKNDATSSYIVWHRSTDSEAKIKLLLYRERNYLITGEHHYFMPQVLLTEEISITGYGFMKLPAQWKTVMTELDKSINKPNDFMFSFMNYQPNYIIGAEYDYAAFDSGSNNTYSTGNANTILDFLYYYDIEMIQ